MTQHAASAESRQRTAALLTDLWRRNVPLIEYRISVLERAAAGPFPLLDELRAEASNVAHKLAGSLGMFGYEEGTEISRSLEHLLESPSTDVSRLQALTAQLRALLLPKA